MSEIFLWKYCIHQDIPRKHQFLLTDHPATEKPVMVFTGDFVFVGDIGRPDLLEKAAGLMGTKEAGARQMFQSLKNLQHYQTMSRYGQPMVRDLPAEKLWELFPALL